MFIRTLLILIGSWLFFRFLRLVAWPRVPRSSGAEPKPNPGSEHSFQDPGIKDGEFEDIDRKGKGGGPA